MKTLISFICHGGLNRIISPVRVTTCLRQTGSSRSASFFICKVNNFYERLISVQLEFAWMCKYHVTKMWLIIYFWKRFLCIMCSIAIDRLYSMILVKGVYFLSPQLKLFFVQVLLPVAVPGVFLLIVRCLKVICRGSVYPYVIYW